ncbi:MAG: hypothetical protein IJA86_09365, partial [Clostridia bacterium]|nr:hypothetical protein [Clostridia bacterium]
FLSSFCKTESKQRRNGLWHAYPHFAKSKASKEETVRGIPIFILQNRKQARRNGLWHAYPHFAKPKASKEETVRGIFIFILQKTKKKFIVKSAEILFLCRFYAIIYDK